MEAHAWRRRRRVAIAAAAAVVVAAASAVLALWIAGRDWQSLLLLGWVPFGVLQLALLLPRRPRRLLRRLEAVRAVIGDDTTAMVVGVDERQSTWWLGARGWLRAYLVLVDAAEGYALWDVRRGRPVQVMRCPWSAVSDAVVREGGARVDLDPAVPGDPTVRLVPTDFRDEPPQLMQTPSRALAFAARIRARLHAFDPEAHPMPPSRGGDVGWAGRG